MQKESTHKWFIALASITIFVAVQLIGYHLFRQTELGIACWWPYISFSVLIALIFTAYHRLFEKE